MRFRIPEHAWPAIRLIAAGLAVVVLPLIGIRVADGIRELRYRPSGPASAAPAPSVQAEVQRRAIDGAVVAAPEQDVIYYAVAVDNLVTARPQSGVAQAPLVIEAPVEGNITRFLAVVASTDRLAKIGPVRSARPYFIDLAAEFDAILVHVGGSPEALERLAKTPTRNMDEYRWGTYFWRDTIRRAPHNTYTSTILLEKVRNQIRGSNNSIAQLAPWKYKDDAPLLERQESGAGMTVSAGETLYGVSWKYDRQANAYRRYQGGTAQKDDGGLAIMAKNVVVQYAKVTVLDNVGRKRIGVIGKGKAEIYLDGQRIAASWSKDAADQRTRYYRESDGEEIVFNAGATWVQILPESAQYDWDRQ